ncbi:hypothetical protein BB561_005816 [Smittium simulii]|uniref:Anaphase-promoting complex subunit 4 WD40 domain-containing protein n=1 Tax=Smittium simulii TaxID=133385 RepID=A0A2T9Y869_9FUNG|nr:hypothetical protein BB561_005816 [Smittium simulii]
MSGAQSFAISKAILITGGFHRLDFSGDLTLNSCSQLQNDLHKMLLRFVFCIVASTLMVSSETIVQNSQIVEPQLALRRFGNPSDKPEPNTPEYKKCKAEHGNKRTWKHKTHPCNNCWCNPKGGITCTRMCPDGTQLLTNSGDNVARIFDYNSCNAVIADNQKLEMKNEYFAEQTILSLAWYPNKCSNDPASCCYLNSTRDQPIKIIDSNYGYVRAKYKSHSDKDELLTAYACSFNSTGERIYAGYFEKIGIFDTQYPGNPVQLIKTSPSRKSSDGLKGIISCIDFPHPLSALSPNSFLSATFSGNMALCDQRSGTISHVWTMQNLTRKPKGITNVSFSPDGNFIFAGTRQSNNIFCWDVRNLSTPISSFSRVGKTQQRVGFIVDNSQNYLICGNLDGSIWFHGLNQNMQCTKTDKFLVHGDAVSDISMHPNNPIIASVSGQRHFNINDSSEDSCSDFDSSIKIFEILADNKDL